MTADFIIKEHSKYFMIHLMTEDAGIWAQFFLNETAKVDNGILKLDKKYWKHFKHSILDSNLSAVKEE